MTALTLAIPVITALGLLCFAGMWLANRGDTVCDELAADILAGAGCLVILIDIGCTVIWIAFG